MKKSELRKIIKEELLKESNATDLLWKAIKEVFDENGLSSREMKTKSQIIKKRYKEVLDALLRLTIELDKDAE